EDVLPSSIRRYNFLPDVKIAGIKCLLSRTGYTGEDGFEILCSPNEAASLWEALIAAGRSDDGLDVQPAGLGARDLLRLEASLPLYGQELSPEISPLQAGLDRFVALEKKIAFTGQDALLKQKEEGLKKRLVGLVMLERGIPRSGYIIKKNQQDIGWISSGTFSPTLQKALGLAFVDSDKAEKGTEVKVVIRNKEYPARIEKLPFYRRES
ncbi:MAG: glycine cleavage system aminomethyltransferase GcvT, partial [Firmicutes bacterium]|nr:glycine cleavage system aminomethyltransferase GcvT [Bacillota bacterium]